MSLEESNRMLDFFPRLLTIILTLFFLMICGYVCRKTKIIDNNASKSLSRLIVTIGQPMMIIGALNNVKFSQENLTVAWQVLLISLVIHLLMAAIALVICKPMQKKDLNRAKVFEFSLVFANVGFIGFPILDSIFGNGIGSFMGAFYVVVFNIFLWTWGIMILARERDDIKLTPKKIFINYGTVPCAIGILLFLLQPYIVPAEGSWLSPAYNALSQFFNYLGSLCTPISVLVTGALLATMPLSDMFKNVKLYFHSGIKLLVFPIVLCLLAKVVGLNDTYVLLVTAMAGVPSAAMVTMLAELHDIEPGYASQSVGMTSILSTATLPFVMLFAQWVTQL